MAKKKKNAKETELTFESSFDELQEIVEKLENGNMSLGDSLKNYEIGMLRLQQCYDALNQAELKIRQMVKLDSDGNLVTGQFGLDDENGEPGRKSTSAESDSISEELF